MKSFKILSVMVLSVFLLQACGSDSKKIKEVVSVTTIVDAAVSNGNFTTLVAALQATGLDATLSNTDSTFTVFAPTDDAFALLGQETIDALLADTDTLSDILTYHVIGGEVNATTAISLAGTTVDMVNGDAIGLSLDGDNLLVNTATVITTDIQTDNGIIHVIDAVLMPPAEMAEPTLNIVETAIANGSFTTLVAALQATDLDTVLADASATFTVFAPTDAAFALIGEETINTLLNNTDVLSSILLQHVVSGASVDSVTAYSLNGVMVETASSANIELKINATTDMLMFGGANVVLKDVYTTNGVIHVIDKVLLPPTVVDIASANANFSTLVGAVVAENLATTLSDKEASYTIFAPTNAAFTAAGTLPSDLSPILLYHVLGEAVFSSDISRFDLTKEISSLLKASNLK